MGRQTLVIRSFDSFVHSVVRRYGQRPGRDAQTFVALLFATRGSLPVALEQLSQPDARRKALVGSAGAAAVALLLRSLLGGPLGLVLTAGSIAGLAKVAVERAPEVRARTSHIRARLGAYERELGDALTSAERGALSEDQLELLIEGLASRLLEELSALDATDAASAAGPANAPLAKAPGANAPGARADASTAGGESFAQHVARRRDPSRR